MYKYHSVYLKARNTLFWKQLRVPYMPIQATQPEVLDTCEASEEWVVDPGCYVLPTLNMLVDVRQSVTKARP